MKIGLKFYPENINPDYVRMIAEHLDFIEVMAKQGSDFSWLGDTGKPFVVHAEHFFFGVNLASREREKRNREALEFAQETADRLDAKFIILHPGILEDEDCSIGNSIEFLRSVGDRRILIENLCWGTETTENTGRTPEEIERLMKATGCGFCLDFSHASTSAFGFGLDYLEFAKTFMLLKPSYFHTSDALIGRTEDRHLHLGEGGLDLNAFKRMIPKESMVCIETYPDSGKHMKDIGFMRGS